MHLTLFIPDLLPPPGAETLMAGGDHAPALRRIFGRGELLRFPPIDAEIWLCQAFEVEQREDWPVAPLTAGVDGLPAESGWWLRADPVHLQLQRNHTRLLAAPALTLDAQEAAALAATLNAHFSGESLELLTPQPARWYFRQDETTGLAAPTLGSLAGRPVPRNPLAGSRASHWHRVLTEAQMLLHEHPVNQAREARGLPAANSLLLWGGGRKPAVPGRHFSQLWSDDPLAIALALQAGAEHQQAPASAALWLGQRPDPAGRHLLMLDRAHLAARYEGPEAWLRTLSTLEERWFAPLYGTLGHLGLDELVIVATGPELCLRCTLRPADKLKFWRRTPAWPALMQPDA
ncbi:MAG: hypothetical protein KF771_08430 [Burkholderiales bacterium]|nr:hypothetical protein [Burkholderiales bacterium]